MKLNKFWLFAVVLICFVISSASQPVFSRENIEQEKTEVMLAELSDEQVRQLLIKELEKKALSNLHASAQTNKSRPVEFIEHAKNKIAEIHERVNFLRSGGSIKMEPDSDLIAFLTKDANRISPFKAVLNLILIFTVAFMVERIFYIYSRPLRTKLSPSISIELLEKLWNLSLELLIKLLSSGIFIVSSILMFLTFYAESSGMRLLFVTYLSAVVVVQLVLISSHFFLAPSQPQLRLFPINTAIAQYLHFRIAAISFIASFGLLTCGIMKLGGISEFEYIKRLLAVSGSITFVLIAMIVQKRKEVGENLSAKFSEYSHLKNLMVKWHHAAIAFILVLFTVSAIKVILGGDYGSYPAIKTLGMIPLYILVDWLLVSISNRLFKFIHRTESETESEKPVLDTEEQGGSESTKTRLKVFFEFDLIKNIIVKTIRIALFLLFVIWTLKFWGIGLPLGSSVVKAALNIMIVFLICYTLWEFLNAAIKQKLVLEMPDQSEDAEEGGSGGSRIGTLLLLLRKFLIIVFLCVVVMVTLSEMGVNIGPLIAGAGVVGLAIGFGAQTLVKDIISGIFFLIDDAFRVGDFIEIGSTKGMVEEISIRSLKLRHPRGMLNTIPFGSIGTVVNFSRDYIITKLDFRVKYDTNVEKVRKIVKKKVYKKILKNEELKNKLLGKIKSQGVRQMDDSAMIMRVKFKSIPGEQFVIRKEVYRLLQEAFKEEGIEFAHKNVTVYIPPETEETDKKAQLAAGAAAAMASASQTPSKEKVPKGSS